jgi:Protein of unknown function (DUF1353)
MADEDKNSKKLSKFEIFISLATLVLSLGTLLIGWQTYHLSASSTATDVELKRLAQEIQNQQFRFDRIRDIYDRIQKYLTSNQGELEGRAIIALVRSMPESENRFEFLSILSANVRNKPIATEAAEIYTKSKQLEVGGESSFIGELKLQFLNDGRSARLVEDFGFIDSKGERWVAPSGTITDGANIPVAFRSILGSQFDRKLVKAAVIHDHYINTREKSVEATNNMFYEALLASGTNEITAKTLYAALQSFGPQWQ